MILLLKITYYEDKRAHILLFDFYAGVGTNNGIDISTLQFAQYI
jgi:hypothetical protein